jgi:hypothetical protein
MNNQDNIEGPVQTYEVNTVYRSSTSDPIIHMTYEQFIEKILRIESRGTVRWLQAKLYFWFLKQNWLRKLYYKFQ